VSEALQGLLEPVTLDDFAARWRDVRPLHIARNQATRFADLLSTEDVERLLVERALSFPDLQLSRFVDPIAPRDYTDEADRIVPTRLLQHHADGATIVLARAQRHLPALGRLCSALQRQTGVRWQANAYLSPAGQQGFGPHYDSHDVFILQVSGRKRFAFYHGGPELPLADQRFDPVDWPAGEKMLERDIDAGSTLYIPRGVMHDAVADHRKPSLHITLGCFAPTVLDVLHTALQRSAEQDVRLRRSLHGQSLGSPAALQDLLETTLLNTTVLDAALSRLLDEVALGERAQVTGLGRRLAEAAALDPDADGIELRLRDGEPWQVTRDEATLHLRCTGSVLSFDGAHAEAVDRLLRARRLPVTALDMLEATQRRVLIDGLVAQNIAELVIVPAA